MEKQPLSLPAALIDTECEKRRERHKYALHPPHACSEISQNRLIPPHDDYFQTVLMSDVNVIRKKDPILEMVLCFRESF